MTDGNICAVQDDTILTIMSYLYIGTSAKNMSEHSYICKKCQHGKP